LHGHFLQQLSRQIAPRQVAQLFCAPRLPAACAAADAHQHRQKHNLRLAAQADAIQAGHLHLTLRAAHLTTCCHIQLQVHLLLCLQQQQTLGRLTDIWQEVWLLFAQLPAPVEHLQGEAATPRAAAVAAAVLNSHVCWPVSFIAQGDLPAGSGLLLQLDVHSGSSICEHQARAVALQQALHVLQWVGCNVG
jgi:hypothetical protein